MITDQLQNLFESTFIKGHSQHMPTADVLQEMLENHPNWEQFAVDDRLMNAMKDLRLNDNKLDSDYSIRLEFRAAIRQALRVLRENGVDIRVDFSHLRVN